jgi:hypothetical protein
MPVLQRNSILDTNQGQQKPSCKKAGLHFEEKRKRKRKPPENLFLLYCEKCMRFSCTF